MKKIILLSFGLFCCLSIKSALEPIIQDEPIVPQNPFDIAPGTPVVVMEGEVVAMERENVAQELNRVLDKIKKAYQKQLNDFKARNTPTESVNQIVTPEMLKDIKILKESVKKLDDMMFIFDLKDRAKDLKEVAFGIINAMQVIDGNLQIYFDLLPEGKEKEYRAVLNDTLATLQKLEKKAAEKRFRNPKKTSVPEFEATQITQSASALMDMAKTIRQTTSELMKLVTVKPKKQSRFKRIFGS